MTTETPSDHPGERRSIQRAREAREARRQLQRHFREAADDLKDIQATRTRLGLRFLVDAGRLGGPNDGADD